MKFLPTNPEELASPSGWADEADRSSKADELAAPQETANLSAWMSVTTPSCSTSTASNFLPLGSVCRRRAKVRVIRVTFWERIAGRTQQISASLFAWT